MLKDSFGRDINYLRISVTDCCNLRCRYCVPHGGFPSYDREDILTFEEILKLVECFAILGVSKIRITGGEPLVRKNLPFLIAGIRRFPEIEDISLSTNGIYLAAEAEALFQAGLQRINISLDTFHPKKFHWITGIDAHEKVLEGIEKAIRVGFHPIKINCVALKGINDDEVEGFVDFARRHPVEVRFIELMPARNCFLAGREHFVSADKIKEEAGQFAELIPEGRCPGEVARVYQIGGGLGKIGFISSVSHSFCGDCNRVRLRADGVLKLCLHGPGTFDLRTPLREGKSREEMIRWIEEAVREKPEGHFAAALNAESMTYMCQIGG